VRKHVLDSERKHLFNTKTKFTLHKEEQDISCMKSPVEQHMVNTIANLIIAEGSHALIRRHCFLKIVYEGGVEPPAGKRQGAGADTTGAGTTGAGTTGAGTKGASTATGAEGTFTIEGADFSVAGESGAGT
jgi:hypothetical protein